MKWETKQNWNVSKAAKGRNYKMNGINESEPSYEVKNYFSYHTNEGQTTNNQIAEKHLEKP